MVDQIDAKVFGTIIRRSCDFIVVVLAGGNTILIALNLCWDLMCGNVNFFVMNFPIHLSLHSSNKSLDIQPFCCAPFRQCRSLVLLKLRGLLAL